MIQSAVSLLHIFPEMILNFDSTKGSSLIHFSNHFYASWLIFYSPEMLQIISKKIIYSRNNKVGQSKKSWLTWNVDFRFSCFFGGSSSSPFSIFKISTSDIWRLSSSNSTNFVNSPSFRNLNAWFWLAVDCRLSDRPRVWKSLTLDTNQFSSNDKCDPFDGQMNRISDIHQLGHRI